MQHIANIKKKTQ